jgi:ankyrin repeat protein
MAAKEDISAVFTLAKYGPAEGVWSLLNMNPTLFEAVDETGMTLLMAAASGGMARTVDGLVERGAAVGAVHSSGSTAIDFAFNNGHEAVVALLLRHGAELSNKDNKGKTLFWRACLNGHVGMVRFMMQRTGCQGLKETDDDGRTALWWACRLGHDRVARALLLAGADLDIADNEGKTPRHVAMNQHVSPIKVCATRVND